MYLDYFGLNEFPFSITPDTSFAYLTQAHQEALNTLLVALRCGEGFVKITGEVGTGKTLLCRRLLQELESDQCRSAYLPNPSLEPKTLFLVLAEELGLTLAPDVEQYHLLRQLNLALLKFARNKQRVVLCVDEAQAMPLETLEALRLLSNLETEKRKLLQIVIFGQPELDEKLAHPSVRQLLQRIAFHYRLAGLSADELAHYVTHRLRVAGHHGDRLFARNALTGLHRASRGVPRLINILAHKALLSAYGEGGARVLRRHVRLAAADTEGARRLGLLW